MNDICIYAKLRQREKNKYRKILTTSELVYSIQDINSITPIEYDYEYKIEENEWFCISEASHKNYMIKAFEQDLDSVDYESLNKEEVRKVDFIFTQIGDCVCCQRVSPAKLVSKKSIFRFGERFEYKADQCEIVIKSRPDAIYVKSKDLLYFKHLESITSIFNGIDQIYREANEEEVTQFLSSDFIRLEQGFVSSKVGKLNRKRIALAEQTLAQLDVNDRVNLFDYINEYIPDLKFSNNSFVISSDKDLEKLLLGIDQRFYTTVYGKEKRVAKSVNKLK